MKCIKLLDIIAYYLSEYDSDALRALDYPSRAECFRSIASKFDKKDSYLRRLRDEYDAVTSSSRRGQCNRPPHSRIANTAEYLQTFSFDKLTEMVKGFIETPSNVIEISEESEEEAIPDTISEDEIERIINFRDDRAEIQIKCGTRKIRVYNTNIIRQLKALYQGRCQLCGEQPVEGFNADICEAHHIQYFSSSQNNDASNIIIVCPNHHRLIHKLNPVFDYEKCCYDFGDGKELPVKMDHHLKR